MRRTPPIHPGEHLAEQLEALNISAAELARRLQVPGNRISQIVAGQRAITGDTSLRLAHYFGTSPNFWMNLQAAYDLKVAQARVGSTVSLLPSLVTRSMRSDDEFAQTA